MVDADLYLLQICATQIPSEVFLTTVMEKWVVWISHSHKYYDLHSSLMCCVTGWLLPDGLRRDGLIFKAQMSGFIVHGTFKPRRRTTLLCQISGHHSPTEVMQHPWRTETSAVLTVTSPCKALSKPGMKMI
jgi:hypothetical protein